MKKLMTDVKYFGHHFFLHTTTMGFIGSSPVEGMNQSIKAGPFASKGNMSIDKSSDNQIRLSNYHELKRNIESGKEIMKFNVWTRSLTSKHLTDYMEAISVRNFDNRMNYVHVCVSKNNWLVSHRRLHEMYELHENGTRLKRINTQDR